MELGRSPLFVKYCHASKSLALEYTTGKGLSGDLGRMGAVRSDTGLTFKHKEEEGKENM